MKARTVLTSVLAATALAVPWPASADPDEYGPACVWVGSPEAEPYCAPEYFGPLTCTTSANPYVKVCVPKAVI